MAVPYPYPSLVRPEPSAAPFLTVGPAVGISDSDSWGLANSPADTYRRTEFAETNTKGASHVTRRFHNQSGGRYSGNELDFHTYAKAPRSSFFKSTGRKIVPTLMTGEIPMAQQPSLAEQLHLETHKAFMRFHAMTLDGHVCEDEQEEILDTFDELTMLADLVHRTQQLGITMMRRGPESARAQRQIRSIEADHGPLDAA